MAKRRARKLPPELRGMATLEKRIRGDLTITMKVSVWIAIRLAMEHYVKFCGYDPPIGPQTDFDRDLNKAIAHIKRRMEWPPLPAAVTSSPVQEPAVGNMGPDAPGSAGGGR